MKRIVGRVLLALPDRPGLPGNTVVLIVVMAAGISIGLVFRSRGFTESNIIMVLLLGVVIVSVLTNRGYGITAAVCTVLAFNYLFTEPRFTLVVDNHEYLVTFPVMFVVAFISSELTARIRRQAEEALRREQHNDLLYRAGRALLKAHGSREVLDTAVHHVQEILDCETIGFLPDDFTGDEAVVRVIETGKRYSGDDLVIVPVTSDDRVLAAVRVSGCAPLTEGESRARASLDAVIAQLAMALDRERLAELEARARLEIEQERLKNQLLQSISHDLRSPLTSIVGFSMMLDQPTLTRTELADTIRSIRTEAQWLSRLVENLLSLSRVEHGAGSDGLPEEWEILDELIAGAVETVTSRFGERSLIVEYTGRPVLVRTSPGLLPQVLVNLLDNAVQHTPEDTVVRLWFEYDEPPTHNDASFAADRCVVRIHVCDNGPGFSGNALERGFDRFFTEKARPDGRRGLGLGLAICKTIVDQLRGSIALKNELHGGAHVEIHLPGRLA